MIIDFFLCLKGTGKRKNSKRRKNNEENILMVEGRKGRKKIGLGRGEKKGIYEK